MDISSCVLTSRQVAEISGIKYATLDYWLREDRGNLLTCLTPAGGRGSHREFSFRDLIRVRVVARMRQDGATLQAIRDAMNILTEEWGEADPLASGRLVVIGQRIFWTVNERELVDILTQQGAIRDLLVVDVGEIIEDSITRVTELAA